MSIHKTKTVITIGRQFGSAGLEIGRKVAKDLGLKLYYKEILDEILPEENDSLSKKTSEKPSSFLYSLVMDKSNAGNYVDMPINHKRFIAQIETIKKITAEEPCVLVGLCADYALASNPNVMSFFIHANIDSRVCRIARKYNVTNAKALDMITERDTKRNSYYNFYTHKKWGEAESYSVCLDSSVLGIDGTTEVIKHLVELKENNSYIKL